MKITILAPLFIAFYLMDVFSAPGDDFFAQGLSAASPFDKGMVRQQSRSWEENNKWLDEQISSLETPILSWKENNKWLDQQIASLSQPRVRPVAIPPQSLHKREEPQIPLDLRDLEQHSIFSQPSLLSSSSSSSSSSSERTEWTDPLSLPNLERGLDDQLELFLMDAQFAGVLNGGNFVSSPGQDNTVSASTPLFSSSVLEMTDSTHSLRLTSPRIEADASMELSRGDEQLPKSLDYSVNKKNFALVPSPTMASVDQGTKKRMKKSYHHQIPKESTPQSDEEEGMEGARVVGQAVKRAKNTTGSQKPYAVRTEVNKRKQAEWSQRSRDVTAQNIVLLREWAEKDEKLAKKIADIDAGTTPAQQEMREKIDTFTRNYKAGLIEEEDLGKRKALSAALSRIKTKLLMELYKGILKTNPLLANGSLGAGEEE